MTSRGAAGATRRPADAAAAPLLSVIVPTYNSARTIARCVAALRAQPPSLPYEVIVVASGSDDTVARARAAWPQVHVVEASRRLGPGAARNLGAKAARGALLGFIDSDAHAAPDWVAVACRALDGGGDIACGAVGNANPGSSVARAEELLMFNEFLTDGPPGPRWFAVSANMVVRAELFARVGGFPDTRAAEDVIFSRRAIAAGARITFEPRLRVWHENRTLLRPFLRNQFLLGVYTVRARRLVPFVDVPRYGLFLALLPVAPAAKLAKIALRLARQTPRRLLALLRELPCFTAGLCSYSAGMVAGAIVGADAIAGAGLGQGFDGEQGRGGEGAEFVGADVDRRAAHAVTGDRVVLRPGDGATAGDL